MKIRNPIPFLLSSFLLFVVILGCGKSVGYACAGGERSSAPGASEPEQAQSQMAPAPVNPAVTGTVAGVVKFAGTPPKAQEIDMTQDPACTMGTPPNFSEAYVVKGGKLANVFVYVKQGLPPGNYGVPTQPVVIDQQGCRYVPHVAGAVTGQKVRFLNSDPTMHNVHPDAQANSPWNITQTPKGEPIEKSFSKPELMMRVSCNQHPWMRMFLNVVETPFFAVTDSEGKFEIKGLPPGEYVLGFVHEKLGETSLPVKVQEQKTVQVEWTATMK